MPGVPLGAGVQVIIGGIPGVNDLQRLIYRVGKVRKVWKWTGVTIKAITNVHECQTPHKKNCSKNKLTMKYKFLTLVF